MRTMLRGLVVLTVLAGSSGVASARDLYVNNVAGNDRYLATQRQPMSEQLGPVKTIGRALEIAIAGDRIVLANTGVAYRESLTLFGSRHSGTEDRPFTILGNGAVLEGADEVHVDGWQHVYDNIFCFRPSRLVYQQLFL
ncbi:MAG: hypothetical protein ACYC6Y_28355, partial [Thermoguttaceae bacterium]